jgi:hypothetical protein
VGRVTLVTVIPFGAAKEDEQRAKAMLQKQVERMAGTPGLDVLEGHPSATLERLAVEGGYDLLVSAPVAAAAGSPADRQDRS